MLAFNPLLSLSGVCEEHKLKDQLFQSSSEFKVQDMIVEKVMITNFQSSSEFKL